MAYVPSVAAVGEIGHWYESGNINKDPAAAIVTKTDKAGFVSVSLFEDNSPQHRTLYGVPHIDNPQENFNPDYLIEKGVWCRPMERVPCDEKCTVENQNFVSLARSEGLSDKEIAEHMGPYWSVDRVKELMPRQTKSNKQPAVAK